ncbi:MAG: DUF167 domain-containing protein [Vulcanimicrobiaceae bacterium]
MHATITLTCKPGNPRPGLHLRETGYELRIRARAIDGKANLAVVADLAEYLKIAPSQIEILHGHRSRIKRVKISGLSQEELEDRLTLAT